MKPLFTLEFLLKIMRIKHVDFLLNSIVYSEIAEFSVFSLRPMMGDPPENPADSKQLVGDVNFVLSRSHTSVVPFVEATHIILYCRRSF